jgi:type II restriction enzyme
MLRLWGLRDQVASVNLSMTGALASAYASGSQRARVVTESWGEQNLYCPNCSSPSLNRLDNNTKASDFSCPKCQFWYQLKGQKTPIRSSITDGAYESMMDAVRHDRTPNFYFMQYELATWRIVNLLLIPHFAFPPSAIIKRKPLSATARRAGWVGCNFALDRIPIDARINVIRDQIISPAGEVRARFRKVKPLSELSVTERGWTLDVLNLVNRLRSADFGLRNKEFKNEDIYAYERELEALHPGNRHIRDKIRQQLQVLRDRGFLLHLSRNRWQIKAN